MRERIRDKGRLQDIHSVTLYDTAVNGIPQLREQVSRYLSETDWSEWEE